MIVADLVSTLDHWFPRTLVESWDNVGLLLGDPKASVERVMTCLTLTPETAAEAIREGADLVVSHHPVFFRPIQRLTADGPNGPAYRIARAGIALYSPHTAFDGALAGINRQISLRLGLNEVRPLRPHPDDPSVGAGRIGRSSGPTTLEDLARRAGETLNAKTVRFVGDPHRTCRDIVIACGAGEDFLEEASRQSADVLLTGEARFHRCLEAKALGIGLILVGHYASERFAIETLVDRMAREWPELAAWASRDEVDPLRTASR